MSNENKPPLTLLMSENPFTCVLCGHRTQSLGPNKMDEQGDPYHEEQCRACGQIHHFYEDEES